MKVVDIKTGQKHEVRKYIKSESDESVWCLTWYGRHVIGQDCEFESNDKEKGKTSYHYETIKCPQCCNIQAAIVEHTEP